MKRTCLAVLLAAIALPAHARDTAEARPIPAVARPDAPDPARFEAAFRFVMLLYPDPVRDEPYIRSVLAMARASVIEQVAEIDGPGYRPDAQREIEAIFADIPESLQLQASLIMTAYAKAYAREFTLEELAELSSFAQSPTGRHFMASGMTVATDADVLAAYGEVPSALEPAMRKVAKLMCQRRTQARIATGDTKAKCPMA